MRWLKFFAAALLVTAPSVFAQDVPAGTVIPVMLTTTIDAATAQPGQQIVGKIMEKVPLPSGIDIPEGAKIIGRVVETRIGYPESPSVLALQFERIVFKRRELHLAANVRALAAMMAVYDAQVPIFVPDRVSQTAWLLAPVGGEAAFRPDNPEKSWGHFGGFVRFSGPPAPGCGDRVDQPGTTGALWVFSPYACGAYGFGKDLSIAHDGATNPVGQIVLISRKKVHVQAGSGFLLRAQSPVPGSMSDY